MSTLSISRMVVPLMVVGTAVVATLVFADRYVGSRTSDDRAIVANSPAAPEPSKPAAPAQEQQPDKLAAVQAEADRLTATLDSPKSAPDAPKSPDKSPERGAEAPEFDVASIQPTGEAVIAGRAAPGATVELLRNGEVHDRTVADQAGLFVLIPRPLPPGNYDLSLHSKQTDGKEATSKQRVAVALEAPAGQQPAIAQAKPSEPSARTPAPATQAPAVMAEGGKSEPKTEPKVAAAQPTPSGSTGTVAPRPPRLAAASPATLPGLTPPSATISPKMTTATVSRGDSLWRISQRALGAGTRYSILYRANRDRIRNANLIYPGQVFILPAR